VLRELTPRLKVVYKADAIVAELSARATK